jgi:hypothetical protein
VNFSAVVGSSSSSSYDYIISVRQTADSSLTCYDQLRKWVLVLKWIVKIQCWIIKLVHRKFIFNTFIEMTEKKNSNSKLFFLICSAAGHDQQSFFVSC